jgi:hypothetical protein
MFFEPVKSGQLPMPGAKSAMPKKRYLVTLTDDERTQLEQLLRGGKVATRKATRARILLKASEGWPDQRIAEALNIGRATVERTRQRFVEENLAALDERPRPGNKPKLDAKAEARLIAEAVAPRPTDRSVGRSACRLIAWCNSSWPNPIPTKRCAGC